MPDPTARTYCRALLWIRLRDCFYPLLPARSFLALGIVSTIAALGLAVAEQYLGHLEGAASVAGPEWRLEDSLINSMNYDKIHSSDDDPVWSSDGFPYPKSTRETKRILVLGDSFVWGDGSTNMNELWWRQLDRELKRRGYWQVEVVAAGLNGASTLDQFRWMTDLGLLSRLRPDAVILGYVTNDPDMVREDGRHYLQVAEAFTPRFRSRRLDATLGRVFPRLTYHFQDRLVRKRLQRHLPDAYPYFDWELRLLEGPNFDAYRQLLRRLGEFLRSTGVPSLAVATPNRPDRDYYEARYRPVVPAFEEAGIPFFDLLGEFERLDRTAGRDVVRTANPVNGHPGPAATRFYGRTVAELLERHYPAVLGRRSPSPAPVEPEINDWMPASLHVAKVAPTEWTFTYPARGTPLLRMPFEKEHVVLSFALPAAIETIAVSGPGLDGAEMFVRAVTEDRSVETTGWYPLGHRDGQSAAWSLRNQPFAHAVTALEIACDIAEVGGRSDGGESNASRKAAALTLRVTFADPAVRP